ncbi:pyruvate:ferredoxin (flavodoxin) oxidoreductase [bacterium]|nr:pyruvate:ferredoxin (flavodoxin) oxidoreductase [bacterium]
MPVLDGNQAAAEVAYACNEVIAIYPITPASPMGEYSDQWSSDAKVNLWGEVPRVVELHSEGGAAGTVHGSLQAGSLTTTFTASQGLLLMLPNMYKIAGELTSTVFHIAARTVATHALSIFGDHSDVMAARTTGWAMLFGSSVQEAHDFALISQMATLESRVPFLHIFDGFRISHEESKIDRIDKEDMLALLPMSAIQAHRERRLSPEHPELRGTAQNPDVFFQSREAANPFYDRCPNTVTGAMQSFAERTGRHYRIFEYFGDPAAERVIVTMGSACQTVTETVAALRQQGERVGLLKVRLFRPFASQAFLQVLPASVERVAVLDRCREPGAVGEPLFQDVLATLSEAGRPVQVLGGRYGLASKEFTPAMVAAVFAELAKPEPRRRFTVGITDDVGHTSLDIDSQFILEDPDSVRAIFWGLGADGTVGANKNSIRIIGDETEAFVQGYFVYDSKKSGARTISHLRFGPRPIGRPYLIQRASFVAVHQFDFLGRFPVLDEVEPGAIVLVNSPHPHDKVWPYLPDWFRAKVLAMGLRLYVVGADRLARESGLGGRINTIMQMCFFHLSGVVEPGRALEMIKHAIHTTYSKQGEITVRRNYAAVDVALEGLKFVAPGPPPHQIHPAEAPQNLVSALVAGHGDDLPVSAFPVDGTYPTGTAHLEKRNLTQEVPVWESDLCIECGKCVYVCPHSVIRAKLVDSARVAGAPEGFVTIPSAFKELPDLVYTLQVSNQDCTGCRLCVEVCPVKDKSKVSRKALNMAWLDAPESNEIAGRNPQHWDYFLQLPEEAPAGLRWSSVKNIQLRQPLFEFSGACAGCGETPYLRVLSQLFGDHLLIANATGCSSIYGGNLPTTPWSKTRAGHGPAWSNSLFEDNAEFGLGMRLALDQQRNHARHLVGRLSGCLSPALAARLLAEESSVQELRQAVAELRGCLDPEMPLERDLLALADNLIPHSCWLVGGDGWAYDIGFGGLDHVLASQARVRALVLDTEVYSNTGGQSSKATPLGAVAKFSSGGKPTAKKDLGLLAMGYGSCYVACVAMGANESQTIKAIQEAESFPGPALIVAYSHCIAHGIDMAKGMQQQKLAVDCGSWLLYRYDPRRRELGLPPLQLDCRQPSRPIAEYFSSEGRFRILQQMHPEEAENYAVAAQTAADLRWKQYSERASQLC